MWYFETNIQLKQGASLALTPQTLNYLGQTTFYETSGYTAVISDVRLMSTFNGIGIDTDQAAAEKGKEYSTKILDKQLSKQRTTEEVGEITKEYIEENREVLKQMKSFII